MAKIILALFMVFMLSGCDWFVKEKIVYKKVEIPVPVECPSPVIKEKPDLLVNHLTKEDKDNSEKIVKYYTSSLKTCMGFVEEQQELLKSYKSKVDNGKN